MNRDLDERARRPKGHGQAVDLGTCEGGAASPSNPSGDNLKSEILRCRVSEAEYALLKARAETSQTSMAELMRNALGLIEAKRPRPIPKADPKLMRKIAGIGINLNQIAHAVNSVAKLRASKQFDAVVLMAQLVSIERVLMAIHEEHRHDD